MKEVRIPLLVAVTAIIGYAAMALLSGCATGDQAPTRYHVTCYSGGQAIVDTEASSFRGMSDEPKTQFTEAHTGKRFWITGDCVVALETR